MILNDHCTTLLNNHHGPAEGRTVAQEQFNSCIHQCLLDVLLQTTKSLLGQLEYIIVLADSKP